VSSASSADTVAAFAVEKESLIRVSLARILLRLARFDGQSSFGTAIPKINQETLAEMVGTTRSRVSFFMNKFRTSGFIDYDTTSNLIRVHRKLLAFCAG
jgi:CRP/FNR family transcriptional regulator, cyclic AMP receptor protein